MKGLPSRHRAMASEKGCESQGEVGQEEAEGLADGLGMRKKVTALQKCCKLKIKMKI